MLKLIAIALLTIGSNAWAGVFICADAQGNKIFQDKPCGASFCTKSLEYYQSVSDQSCIKQKQSEIAEQKKMAKAKADAEEAIRLAQAEKEERLSRIKWRAEQDEKLRQEAEAHAIKLAEAQKREADKAIRAAKSRGKYYVQYVVSGSAKYVGITMRNSSGNTEQHDVTSPWVYEFEAAEGSSLYISAQNSNDYGDVNTIIKINGMPFSPAQSTSDYGIATSSLILR
ncbi:hypothetical protein [Thalassolituus oleivorans]|uniref:hypothetical protein n=1 Tax=Thalassolituus oleivorans TaxID=187493 RepID=UPI0023F3C17C|nr:hypothetical protein [Thalassolituus oleivorans]